MQPSSWLKGLILHDNCLFGQLSWAKPFTQLSRTYSSSLPYLHFTFLNKLLRKGRTQWFCILKMSFFPEDAAPSPVQGRRCCRAASSQALECPCIPVPAQAAALRDVTTTFRAPSHRLPAEICHKPLQRSRLWRVVCNKAEQHLEPHILQQSLPW